MWVIYILVLLRNNLGEEYAPDIIVYLKQAGAELGQAQPQLRLRLTNVEI